MAKKIVRAVVPMVLVGAALAFVATQKHPCHWVAASPKDPPSFVPGYERVKLWSSSQNCAKCHRAQPAMPR